MEFFFITILLFLMPLAAGRPLIAEERATGDTANEFTKGGCRANIFIFARGSTEDGNLGDSVGPRLSDGLKQALGEQKVATEGVEYDASLVTNVLPGGCSQSDAEVMAKLITQATTQCPTSKIVVGGYSQGAALTHAAFAKMSAATRNRVTAVAMFGDTQNEQQNGQIANYPKEKVKIICNDGDEVCDGTLIVLPPHLEYNDRVPEATTFLVSKLKAA